MRIKKCAYIGLFVSFVLVFAGCGVKQNQIVDGKTLYQENCMRCHGRELTSGTAPDLRDIGKRWDEEKLYEYISNNMPYDKPKSLTKKEYQAVTKYLFEKGA